LCFFCFVIKFKHGFLILARKMTLFYSKNMLKIPAPNIASILQTSKVLETFEVYVPFEIYVPLDFDPQTLIINSTWPEENGALILQRVCGW
jgi:hypothetical protein